MTEWLDISSAPKDGSCIIVRREIATVEIVRNAFWDDGEFWRGTGFSSQEELAGWWSPTSSCGSEKLESLYEPTHWMPLPPVPGEDTVRKLDGWPPASWSPLNQKDEG